MASERIQKTGTGYRSFDEERLLLRRYRRAGKKPVEAITLDSLELSGEKPDTSSEYAWLVESIKQMSNETVARKMKTFKVSFPTIDDALAEKIVMEAL
jgi:hypothetical protein